MASQDFDQLHSQIDATVHTNGSTGKTTAPGLNALLHRFVTDLPAGTSLPADQLAALAAAIHPSADNPYATIADVASLFDGESAVAIEQELSSNSTTSVPSVAAVVSGLTDKASLSYTGVQTFKGQVDFQIGNDDILKIYDGDIEGTATSRFGWRSNGTDDVDTGLMRGAPGVMHVQGPNGFGTVEVSDVTAHGAPDALNSIAKLAAAIGNTAPSVTVEQDLSSHSTTAVPSVAAVSVAVQQLQASLGPGGRYRGMFTANTDYVVNDWIQLNNIYYAANTGFKSSSSFTAVNWSTIGVALTPLQGQAISVAASASGANRFMTQNDMVWSAINGGVVVGTYTSSISCGTGSAHNQIGAGCYLVVLGGNNTYNKIAGGNTTIRSGNGVTECETVGLCRNIQFGDNCKRVRVIDTQGVDANTLFQIPAGTTDVTYLNGTAVTTTATSVTVEQDLTSNSTTSVPSVAAVKAAVSATMLTSVPVFTVIADGAQTITLPKAGTQPLYLQLLSAQGAVDSVWLPYASISGTTLTITAAAGIKAGDQITGAYL